MCTLRAVEEGVPVVCGDMECGQGGQDLVSMKASGELGC